MQYRTLGRTGIKVSPYALGAMMFGAIGNPDHDDSIAIIHKALDAGINFIDTSKQSGLIQRSASVQSRPVGHDQTRGQRDRAVSVHAGTR